MKNNSSFNELISAIEDFNSNLSDNIQNIKNDLFKINLISVLYNLMNEIEKIGEISKASKLLEEVYAWQNKKILSSQINRISDDHNNLQKKLVEEINTQGMEPGNGFNYKANFDPINEMNNFSLLGIDTTPNKSNARDKYSKERKSDSQQSYRTNKMYLVDRELENLTLSEYWDKKHSQNSTTYKKSNMVVHRDVENKVEHEKIVNTHFEAKVNQEDQKFNDKNNSRLQEWNQSQNRPLGDKGKPVKVTDEERRSFNVSGKAKREEKLKLEPIPLRDPHANPEEAYEREMRNRKERERREDRERERETAKEREIQLLKDKEVRERQVSREGDKAEQYRDTEHKKKIKDSNSQNSMIFEQTPIHTRPVSEQLRQLRENNNKILGLTENNDFEEANQQFRTEDMKEDETMQHNMLLSQSHNELIAGRQKSQTNILDSEDQSSRPSTAFTLSKSYNINNFKEFIRDNRFRMREEVDHMKRTFANKGIKINGDVVYKALMTPEMDTNDLVTFKPPNMRMKLMSLNNPIPKKNETGNRPKKNKNANKNNN